MNKPCGYVCTAKSDSHNTVFDLLPPEIKTLQDAKRGHRLHTVGRLDCDTSGLLLITTDGFFSHNLTSPENHVEKKYHVVLEQTVDLEHQFIYKKQFLDGVILPAEKKADEQKSLPAEIEFISDKECFVYVKEGKFHQVRRMFTAVGNKVIALKRLSMGDYSLPDDLFEGQYKLFSI